MIDTNDFSFFENRSSFDFKGLLLKITSYWKWFILSLLVSFGIAHQVNVRKEKVYSLDTSIAIKEENNPFIGTNTSLVFNWGGTSDQVQNISNTLKSRSHNEKVVDQLDFYIDYLQEGEYNYLDVYGGVPFHLTIDKNKEQLLNSLIRIQFLNATEYEIRIVFETANANTVRYSDNSKTTVSVLAEEFVKKYKLGEAVVLPFLHWKLEPQGEAGSYKGKTYFVRFNDFDTVVSRYQNIGVDIDTKAPSILKLSLQGSNKNRLTTYLNATVEVLIKSQLDRKNQFATNTISFIDSTLIAMGKQLKETGAELKTFSANNNVVALEQGGATLSDQLLDYDVQKEGIARKIAYYTSLKNYLKKSVDYAKLPAPSVAGIEDPNIVSNISKLISLSTQRSELSYSVKSDRVFREFDNQMEAIKRVLLENIKSAVTALDYDLILISTKISKTEGSIKKLPQDKQDYLKIVRKYDLSDNIYTSFLQKRNEAEIAKAANLSDIHFIDSAKDIGGGLIGPNTSVNYVLALFLGLLVPLLVIFTLFFLDDSILKTEEIIHLTSIPIIGIVGLKQTASNLSVFEKPKSALSESFRAIRSSLQFLYKKQAVEAARTIMVTSSIGGEGKTFCSLNIATVLALSDRKTIVVGLDLRKPKIFEDFAIEKNIGVVNYLIGQHTFEEVIQHTHIPNLDVVTCGPIPPNPSELLIGESMTEFIQRLKSEYDYVILDTAPVGLVSDAIELTKFADLTLYIMRQNYTKKEMVALLNNRLSRGELSKVSIIFNGFENKAKYGTAHDYAYGYGNYTNSYHVEDKPRTVFDTIRKRIFRN